MEISNFVFEQISAFFGLTIEHLYFLQENKILKAHTIKSETHKNSFKRTTLSFSSQNPIETSILLLLNSEKSVKTSLNAQISAKTPENLVVKKLLKAGNFYRNTWLYLASGEAGHALLEYREYQEGNPTEGSPFEILQQLEQVCLEF